MIYSMVLYERFYNYFFAFIIFPRFLMFLIFSSFSKQTRLYTFPKKYLQWTAQKEDKMLRMYAIEANL